MKLRVVFLILVSFVSLVRSSENSTSSRKCHLCQKVLSTPSNLTVHLRIHDASTKNLKCFFCSKTFRRKYNLKAHQQNIHSNHSVKCPDCGKRFSTKGNLTRHRKAKHEYTPIHSGQQKKSGPINTEEDPQRPRNNRQETTSPLTSEATESDVFYNTHWLQKALDELTRPTSSLAEQNSRIVFVPAILNVTSTADNTDNSDPF